jgi:hypothetical protein
MSCPRAADRCDASSRSRSRLLRVYACLAQQGCEAFHTLAFLGQELFRVLRPLAKEVLTQRMKQLLKQIGMT